MRIDSDEHQNIWMLTTFKGALSLLKNNKVNIKLAIRLFTFISQCSRLLILWMNVLQPITV